MSIDIRVRIRIEWQDDDKPWAYHMSPWPHDVRVPVVGDYIEVPSDGARKVTTVIWALDGSAVVRLESHPR